MKISISGQHMEITDSLRSHVSEKIEKITRHFDHVTGTNVVLHVEKTRYIAEANINIKGAMIRASSEAGDMYAAIDSLAHKLDRQVIKHKEKLNNHHKNEDSIKQIPE